MKKKTAAPLIGFLVFLLLVLLLFFVEDAEKQRYREVLRSQTTSRLSQLRAEIEAGINVDFYLTRGLIAYIATHSGLSQDSFQRWANNLLQHRHSIINIGIAPDNIVSFVYPLEGNERAIGLDYTKNKTQWPSVKQAIEAHKTVVAGPVNLVQGGVAFISRTPIYIDKGESEGDKTYWGMASIVIDKDRLLRAAGYYAFADEFQVALRGVDGKGAAGDVIEGATEIFERQPVLLDVNLPEGSWQLAAIPLGGWLQPSPRLWWFRSLGLCLAVIAGLGMYVWLVRVDRTQRKVEQAWLRAEQANKESQKQQSFLNAVIENIPHVTFVKDAKELRYLRFNRAGEKLTGLFEKDLLGKNDYDLFSKEEADFFIAEDRKVLENKKMLSIAREKVSTRNKGERLMHTKKIPILDADGTPEYLLGIAEDITERCQAESDRLNLEKQLYQAQKMEAIGLMAGGVAHDLNNILAAITGYPELILRKLPADSDLRKPLQTILESGKRGVAIVADMLTVARGAASVREKINLNHLIAEYLESPECLNTKKHFINGSIDADLTTDLVPILASPVHIKKCLMNLVNNAVEAMAGKGRVTLTSWNETVVGESRNGHHLVDGKYVVLQVADDGPGISGVDIEHIFEPFYTKKVMGKSGTGLGLTVVWNTVKDHSGRIFVSSNPGETVFYLYFPAYSGNDSAGEVTEELPTFSGQGQRVLVVDDEEHMRDIACRILELAGYQPIAASSGEEAISYVAATPVDLLVIDMLMEPGINGCETYRRIVARNPGQKALIASGYSESEEVRAALKLGASRFISKPYSIDQLCQAVHDALSEEGEKTAGV
ncbi:PAS domain S-box-containing protein [Malonomonas rubra DSM 5091]|uniref:histidine kinase n=1 Tax=Malonomonas rubra DSM 5091 TaxID=1122189 RepID=A0A1M6K1N8_MALRU|nr:response regulator [Malonomonas rubra]SHJ52834.1 PAS domain S-box-containing protein [Malonomonas rubra DSM 5091]